MAEFLESVLLSFGLLLTLSIIIRVIFAKMDADAQKALPQQRVRCDLADDLHDWAYHPVTKKLTCTKCNYEAGSYD